MDVEGVKRIKLQAEEALCDFSASGFLGWSAMTASAQAANLIEGLTEANAAETLPKLRGLADELAQLYAEVQSGRQRDAFEVALGRISLVAKVAADALATDP